MQLSVVIDIEGDEAWLKLQKAKDELRKTRLSEARIHDVWTHAMISESKD
jgi:hypothetical protein